MTDKQIRMSEIVSTKGWTYDPARKCYFSGALADQRWCLPETLVKALEAKVEAQALKTVRMRDALINLGEDAHAGCGGWKTTGEVTPDGESDYLELDRSKCDCKSGEAIALDAKDDEKIVAEMKAEVWDQAAVLCEKEAQENARRHGSEDPVVQTQFMYSVCFRKEAARARSEVR